jgi:hypothetical protein
VLNGLDSQARVSFETGQYYWRLSFENTVLSDGRLSVTDGTGLQLISPALNSLFRYRDSPPVLTFQWTQAEEALSYIMEVSGSPDFSSAKIRAQTASVNYTDSSLGAGTWYWRVMPVFPAVFNGRSSFSQTAFFRIEQGSAEQAVLERNSIEDLIAAVAPSKENLPPEIPPELVPADWKPRASAATSSETKPAANPTQPERKPQTVSLLPPPVVVRPTAGKRYGLEELRTLKNIVFEWKTVQGANAYIFTLYKQVENGRRRITGTSPSAGTSNVLDDLKVLENGTFIWQVEAVRVGRNGVIERRGRPGEYRFVLDFPPPEPVQIEDAGILYGN